MPIIFVENMIRFGGKWSCLTFYNSIKMFIADKVLFTMIEEKPSELLTLVMAFVCQKYKIYIFYGVNICDKHSSIINIKEGICDKHEAIKNDKMFWRENFPLTFHFCDNIYPSQLIFLFL